MKRQTIYLVFVLAGALLCTAGYTQERLDIDFPNGDFERTEQITGVDGSSRPGPADSTIYSGFTNGGGYGDSAALLEITDTETRPDSPGQSSIHILHPPSRFPTRYQTHFGQTTSLSTQDLVGLTFDVELWIRTENWWGNNSHYLQAWIMPVDSEGFTLGETHALDPLAMFIGGHPDDPYDPVPNTVGATTEWTLYRIENMEIEEPDTFGFYFQLSAWYNNSDNGNRTSPHDEGERTGDADAWIDDLRIVIPSGSDETDVESWMLH